MSFSSEVKEELLKTEVKARHCKIAELSAILSFCAKVMVDEENNYQLLIHVENEIVAERLKMLLESLFSPDLCEKIKEISHSGKRFSKEIIIDNHTDCVVILQTIKLLDSYGNLEEQTRTIHQIVLQSTCCKRAFLRGAFLAAGSISAPDKKYHFEIVCRGYEQASQIMGIMNFFELDSKIVKRKKYYIVYVKEGEKIVDSLNVMGAYVSLMNLENIRIVKDVRNQVNRQVNCETANIKKTVSAAIKQKEDILYLQAHNEFHKLPQNLQEIANLRLEYPTASLQKLGQKLDPPVGKSGVNHRLRKISLIAEDIRNGKR